MIKIKKMSLSHITALEHKLSDAHSGLGMGIARNIANIHGGELELKDRNGGGLIVEVYFPA